MELKTILVLAEMDDGSIRNIFLTKAERELLKHSLSAIAGTIKVSDQPLQGIEIIKPEQNKKLNMENKKEQQVIIVWKDGTSKKVEHNSSWEFENDSNWLTTIRLDGFSSPIQSETEVSEG